MRFAVCCVLPDAPAMVGWAWGFNSHGHGQSVNVLFPDKCTATSTSFELIIYIIKRRVWCGGRVWEGVVRGDERWCGVVWWVCGCVGGGWRVCGVFDVIFAPVSHPPPPPMWHTHFSSHAYRTMIGACDPML